MLIINSFTPVNSDSQSIERFVKFKDIYQHTTENLTSTAIKTIKQFSLNIENSVGQRLIMQTIWLENIWD